MELSSFLSQKYNWIKMENINLKAKIEEFAIDCTNYKLNGLCILSQKEDVYKRQVLEGDIALAQKNIGQACQLYEQAIYFDPNCKEAYLKLSLIHI